MGLNDKELLKFCIDQNGNVAIRTTWGTLGIWWHIPNILVYEPNQVAIPWVQYPTVQACIDYALTQNPSLYNRRGIEWSWVINEDLIRPDYVQYIGMWVYSTIFTGAINFEGMLSPLSNCMYNAVMSNLALDSSALPPTPITLTVTEIQPRVPETLNRWFQTTPTTGSYNIIINGTVFAVAYNADATALTAMFVGSFPGTTVTGTGTYHDPFIALFPSQQAGTMSFNIVNDITTPVDAIISFSYFDGSTQQQEIVMSGIATGWDIQLRIKWNGIVYDQQIVWNDDTSTINTKIQLLLQTIEIANPWLVLGSATTQTNGDLMTYGIMDVLFIGSQNEIPLITVSNNTLVQATGVNVLLKDCVVLNATNSWPNNLSVTNTQIMGGDFSSLTLLTADENSFISDDSNVLLLPLNTLISNGKIKLTNGNSLLLGLNMKNGFIDDIIPLAFNAWWTYEIDNSTYNWSHVTHLWNGVDMTLKEVVWTIQLVYDTNSSLTTKNCGLESQPVANWGSRDNAGFNYDNTGSLLGSLDGQQAIDELAWMITTLTGIGDPRWVTSWQYLWQRYQDNDPNLTQPARYIWDGIARLVMVTSP